MVEEKERLYAEEKERLQKVRSQGKSLWDHLRSHESFYASVVEDRPAHVTDAVVEQIEIDARYEAYIKREMQQVKQTRLLEHWKIPGDFDYKSIGGLRNEARLKLIRFRPETLGQASRIDGVTPAEIGLIQVHLKRLA